MLVVSWYRGPISIGPCHVDSQFNLGMNMQRGAHGAAAQVETCVGSNWFLNPNLNNEAIAFKCCCQRQSAPLQHGYERNPTQAFQWYQSAASQGHARAGPDAVS